MLARAVSPHLAAADEGRVIALDAVAGWLAPLMLASDVVVVELPGGLYTPLSTRHTNANLVASLAPFATLVVAPDRLGVLHDLGALSRAARADGLRLHGIVLSTPAARDASTGSNAAGLPIVTDVPLLATIPRASVEDLARGAELSLAEDLLRAGAVTSASA
jgi:dethiobiotin synthetase